MSRASQACARSAAGRRSRRQPGLRTRCSSTERGRQSQLPAGASQATLLSCPLRTFAPPEKCDRPEEPRQRIVESPWWRRARPSFRDRTGAQRPQRSSGLKPRLLAREKDNRPGSRRGKGDNQQEELRSAGVEPGSELVGQRPPERPAPVRSRWLPRPCASRPAPVGCHRPAIWPRSPHKARLWARAARMCSSSLRKVPA